MKPQLTLRDLFWLVLVCGLALGWWVDHRAASIEHERLTEDLKWWATKGLSDVGIGMEVLHRDSTD
jgi:hypothetical protein